jgi:hypothetical protein
MESKTIGIDTSVSADSIAELTGSIKSSVEAATDTKVLTLSRSFDTSGYTHEVTNPAEGIRDMRVVYFPAALAPVEDFGSDEPQRTVIATVSLEREPAGEGQEAPVFEYVIYADSVERFEKRRATGKRHILLARKALRDQRLGVVKDERRQHLRFAQEGRQKQRAQGITKVSEAEVYLLKHLLNPQ